MISTQKYIFRASLIWINQIFSLSLRALEHLPSMFSWSCFLGFPFSLPLSRRFFPQFLPLALCSLINIWSIHNAILSHHCQLVLPWLTCALFFGSCEESLLDHRFGWCRVSLNYSTFKFLMFLVSLILSLGFDLAPRVRFLLRIDISGGLIVKSSGTRGWVEEIYALTLQTEISFVSL